ncbi:MAG TPA: PfkB family carbohydrate kinase, partial [Candidatus Nanoarchaeia archaeon]|nr:PfkB family carbohydrate kinase [Candidatus Nanoarchaeia archaeon]
VLLGNIDPELQAQALAQFQSPRLVVLDSMNFWIQGKRKSLLEIIRQVDILVLNDAEARQLFETPNLAKAARKALLLGPRAVIWKKGEHGALLFTADSHFSAAGYPLEDIKDPTGCGDTFAGALIGYMAKHSAGVDDHVQLRRAMVHASALASFNAEDFSLMRLTRLTPEEISVRVAEFHRMREF